MKFNYIVPDHGALGDGSLIEQDFQFFTELQADALRLKKQGESADEAGTTLLAEFKTKFPAWPNLSAIPNVVKHGTPKTRDPTSRDKQQPTVW